jgi:hypothetical protein
VAGICALSSAQSATRMITNFASIFMKNGRFFDDAAKVFASISIKAGVDAARGRAGRKRINHRARS